MPSTGGYFVIGWIQEAISKNQRFDVKKVLGYAHIYQARKTGFFKAAREDVFKL
jgi:hypothetical protein